mmetsp:Transcript_7625/g.18833  ORF Transcript_7625/g.18833 Transcript_7625/m.18833 type:complete len:297 (+) Transcript_7625:1686-2576(+)
MISCSHTRRSRPLRDMGIPIHQSNRTGEGTITTGMGTVRVIIIPRLTLTRRSITAETVRCRKVESFTTPLLDLPLLAAVDTMVMRSAQTPTRTTLAITRWAERRPLVVTVIILVETVGEICSIFHCSLPTTTICTPHRRVWASHLPVVHVTVSKLVEMFNSLYHPSTRTLTTTTTMRRMEVMGPENKEGLHGANLHVRTSRRRLVLAVGARIARATTDETPNDKRLLYWVKCQAGLDLCDCWRDRCVCRYFNFISFFYSHPQLESLEAKKKQQLLEHYLKCHGNSINTTTLFIYFI